MIKQKKVCNNTKTKNMNAINKEVEWQDMTFSYTKDDEYNDYELDGEEKGPALEIYGTDLTYT
jgi:hypothetical protein